MHANYRCKREDNGFFGGGLMPIADYQRSGNGSLNLGACQLHKKNLSNYGAFEF